MFRLANALFCLLMIAVLTGCSGSGGSGGASGNGPQTPADAIAKLSPSHRQNFEAWKVKVVKSCDPSGVFGLDERHDIETAGIDAAVLIRQNNNSAVFTDGDSIAIVSGYDTFSGIGNSKVEQTVSTNGQSYMISAETKREGSQCSVYLYGQKVFQTYIVESFTIGSQWTAGKAATTTSALPRIRTIGASGVGEATQHGAFKLLTQTFSPSKEGISLVAKKIGLNDTQAAQLLKIGNASRDNSAIRIANEPSALWSNYQGNNLLAKTSVLKEAFDGASRNLSLEVRLEVPDFSFGEVKNSTDVGNFELNMIIAISKKDDGFAYTTQSVSPKGIAAFDRDEALACAEDRAMAYVGGSHGANQIQPSVSTMLSPCRTLFRQIENASYESGLMKSLAPEMFAGVLPSKQTQYEGWDEVLSTLALEALEQNKDIRSELDPTGKARLVGIVADHLGALKQELGRTRSMDQSKHVVYKMGLNWSFTGEIVGTARISQILQAVDNSVDPFLASSERLLEGLSVMPNSHNESLSFAKGIDASYKAQALKALELSKALDYSYFVVDVFDQVIQSRVSMAELNEWTTKFSTIKTEIEKHPNLGQAKGKLVGLSLKWLQTGEAKVEDLGPIYAAIDNSQVPFEESTSDLMNALSKSLPDNQAALAFARALTPEYKQLAIAIRDSAKAADYERWGQTFFRSILQERPSIEQLRAWNDMWSSAFSFIQREKERTKDEFGSNNDRNLKQVIETATKETWSSSEFTGLEAIAEVALAKTTCGRHKGYSSLADCAGMRLFTKQKGMFFAPAWNGRYTALGKDFATYMKQLSSDAWSTLRWKMVGEFFGAFEPIWSKCGQEAFSQKASALKSQVNALVRTSDTSEQWEIERQIRESINNCR